ncbi:MAG: flagellar biosynthesis protein FliQ [Actinomycetes bacterium]
MTDTSVLSLATQTMVIAAKLAGPILLTALVVGLVISLFQSLTQIQEMTLSFVPKLVAVGLVLLLAGNWMLHQMVAFTQGLFSQLPGLLAHG